MSLQRSLFLVLAACAVFVNSLPQNNFGFPDEDEEGGVGDRQGFRPQQGNRPRPGNRPQQGFRPQQGNRPQQGVRPPGGNFGSGVPGNGFNNQIPGSNFQNGNNFNPAGTQGGNNFQNSGNQVQTPNTTSTTSTTASQDEMTTTLPPRDPTNRIVYIVSCPCPFTRQYTPVCGSDGQTYGNIGVLNCARTCGTNVTTVLMGACVGNRG